MSERVRGKIVDLQGKSVLVEVMDDKSSLAGQIIYVVTQYAGFVFAKNQEVTFEIKPAFEKENFRAHFMLPLGIECPF